MNTRKKWGSAALILLATGVLMCGIAFAAVGFDLEKLSTGKFVTKTHAIEEDFHNIKVDVDTEKVFFAASEDGSCRVVCYEEEEDPCNVRVEGQTLVVDKAQRHNWIWHIGLVTYSPEITVYLPEAAYGELSIETDTGDIVLPADFSFDSIAAVSDTGDISCAASASGNIHIKTDTGDIKLNGLSASGMELESDTGAMELSNIDLTEDLELREATGRVTMENVSCRNFTSDGDTGSLTMVNVVASESFNLQRDTGNIKFDGCDAETIYARTDTGSVTGSLLTEKVFVTETDTGSVEVPRTIAGGRCEITTDTGNICIEIE